MRKYIMNIISDKEKKVFHGLEEHIAKKKKVFFCLSLLYLNGIYMYIPYIIIIACFNIWDENKLFRYITRTAWYLFSFIRFCLYFSKTSFYYKHIFQTPIPLQFHIYGNISIWVSFVTIFALEDGSFSVWISYFFRISLIYKMNWQ